MSYSFPDANNDTVSGSFNIPAYFSAGPIVSAHSVSGGVFNETTPPTVTSITRGFAGAGQIPETTDSDVISWFVRFSEAITRPDSSDFTVTGTTASISVSHVNDDEYEISLFGGDIATVNGTVTLNFADGQSITDTAGNALVNVTPSGANDNFFNMVNNTVPAAPSDLMVTSIVNPNPGDAAQSLLSLSWTVSADDGGDAITQQDISIYSDAFCAAPVFTGAFRAPAVTSGDVALDLANFPVGAVPSFTIQAVNSVGSSVPSNCVSTTIPAADTTPPTFTAVSIASNNADDEWAKSGDVITLTLQADEPLAAAPTVTIAGQAATVTGGGANWSATVTVTEATTEGPAAINISAFEDANGNAGTAVTATTDMSAVTVDVTRPTPTTTQRKLPLNQNTNADSLTFTVNFSEPMIDMSIADFRETSGEPGNTEPTSISTTTGQSVDVTFADPKFANMNRSMGVNLRALETATDRAGNQILTAIPTGSREVYQVDNIEPTILSIVRLFPSEETTDSDTLYWRVTFNETVANFDASFITVTGTTASVIPIPPTENNSMNVRLSGGDLENLNGPVSFSINGTQNIRDRAGNKLVVAPPTGANESSYTVVNDTAAPTLTSIVRKTPIVENTNANSLTWTVTFSESVQNVGLADFSLSGTTAGLSVTGSGATYDVTASGGDLASLTGYGRVVSLSLANPLTIEDLAGNALTTQSATGTVENYTVSNAPPVVNTIARGTSSATGGVAALTNDDVLAWNLQFSSISSQFALTPADFTLTGTTATITSVDRYSIGFMVQASGGDLAGLDGNVTLGFSNTTPFDEFGNAFSDKTPRGVSEDSYTLDNTAPTLVSIVPDAGIVSPTDADTISFIFTYSEDLDVSSANIANVLVTGTTATVTITPISASVARVTLTGGDLADLNGTVTVGLNSVNNVTDPAGNPIASINPTGTNNNTIQMANDVTAPTLSGVAMTSNNASPEFAKAGDVITLTFTADEALQTPAVTIAGQTASVSNVGNNYTATITVGPATPDGQAIFNISYSDLAGNAGVAVSNDTLFTVQRVNIITTIPTLTEVTAVPSLTTDNTPDVVLNSTAGGDIAMTEARCALPAPVSRSPGNHTITFDTLADGIYNCTAVLTDSAGNKSAPLTLTPFTIDTTAPVAPTAMDMVAASDSGDSDGDNITNVRQPTFTVTVPADAANVFFFANGAQIGTSVPTSTTVTYMSYTSLDDGNFSITAKSVDAAGNESVASSGLTITIDGTAPTTSITSTETGPVLAAGFPVTVTFSESVASTPTVTPGNGQAGTVTTDDNTIFNFRVFPDETGPVTVDVPAGTTADLAGNLNVAAPQFSINADVTNPTILSVLRGFNGVSRIPETTSLDVVSWRIKFSEDIIRPVASDFLVTGTTSPITISEVNADEYEISLAGGDIATVNGAVTLSISRGNEIKDVAGNGVGSLFPSGPYENSFIMDNDVVAPTAELSQYNPALVSGPFTLSVTLSEPPAGFTVDDFTVINGTASNLLPRLASGFEGKMGMAKARRAAPVATSYFVTITPTNAGEVTVSLPAGVFQDTSGNDNIASNAVSVTFDNTRPTLTITSDAGPTVSGPFVVTLTFSEGVDPRDGFGGSRTVVGNGTVTDITTVSDSVYTLEITPSAAGPVTLDIQDDAASDIAGNGNVAATQFSVVNDTTLPTVLSVMRATPATAETDADTLVFAVTFSEPVANIDGSDFAFSGTTATAAVTAINAATYQVTASGGDLANINAEVGLVFSDSQNITDITGVNALSATTPSGANETFTVINDAEAPTVLIASLLDGPVSGEFPITVTFSEDVIAFTVDDLTIGNGTTSEFSATSDSVYTATVTPNGDGLVTVDVAAATAQDVAGNDNIAAPQFSITSDATVPTVAITSGSADPVSGAFTATFTFSEDVTGFALADITVGNGAASAFDATDGAVYTALITPTADGPVTVDVAAATAQDSAGNDNTAAAQFSITSDGTVPTVAITSGSADAVSGAFTATFTFSEDVTGFALGDITVVNGAASAFDATDGAVYTALITPTADGPVTVDVAAASAQDSAGNDNTAAAQFSITSDGTVPTVAITSGSADAVSGAFTATFTFSEDVTGFALGDITVGNGVASGFDAASALIYTALITPTADGLVTVDVAAATAQDSAGNDNTAAAQFSITSDGTVPTVAITSGSADPVSAAFTATFTFSEDVTGFALGDITVGNGAASAFDATDGAVYTALITPTADGLVTVDVAAATAQDSAGNNNIAAPQFSITSDATVPTVAITSGATDPVSGAFTATFTFSEDVTGFALGDITVGNGTASAFDAASGAVYTALITPTADGIVTIDVAASSAQDSAGNDNIAATQFSITSDTTVPTVLASAPPSSVNGAFDLVFTFSEDMTGLAASDLTVINGTAALSGGPREFTITITPDGNGDINIDLPANVATDAAGNGNQALAETVTVLFDATAPTVTSSAPPSSVNGPFDLVFTFSEPMTGLSAADFGITNGTVTLTGGPLVFVVTITPDGNGDISVNLPANIATDPAGNGNAAFDATFEVTFDPVPPTVAVSSPPSSTNGPFDLEFSFSEDMTGLTASDFNVENGTVVVSGGPRDFIVTITPDGNGNVSVNLPANVATDPAGNGNEAFETVINVNFDVTTPSLSLSTDNTDVTGPFTITATFSEAVTGFTADDITVENGTLSDFSGDETVFSALVTPLTIGDVVITVADGAADDLAGNASTGDSLSVTASGGEVTVELDLTTAVLDASTVSTDFSLSNPGSEPIFFTASSDQPWVDVTPGSGKIDTLSNIDFNIQLNDAIDDLAPGTYVATVTVEIVDGPAASAKSGTASNAVSNRVLAQVPVTVNVEERFGNFELIVLTPTSPANSASFTYTSSIAALDALSVPGNAGEVRTSVADLINGAYTLAQSVPDGYQLTSIRCSGDTDGGTVVNLETATVEIDLDASESISCIFENTRDEDAIRIATQRSIRNFMARRGDRVLEATPDLSQRFAARRRNEGGQFSATGTDLRTNMNLETSLSGFRNRAIDNETGSWSDLSQPSPSKWDVWASAEYTRYDDERADSGIDGKFFAAQFGADYLVKPNLIVGAMVQYDWMSEFDKEPAQGLGTQIGADVSGDGVMAGPYFVWQAKEQLIVDVVGLWGQSENEVNPLGYYSDSFDTDRFLVRANVTGEFASGPWRLRPQVSLSHYEDKQSSYVDSLAIDIPEQTVTIGRLRAGPELVWTHQTDTGTQFEIGGSLRAVWNYNGAGLMDQSGRISGGSDPVRADGDISVGTRLPNGVHLRASAGFDGIGKGDFSARSGRLELVFPFGGQGGNGTKESSEELALAGFQRACEAEAYLQSFNIGGSAACSGEPRKNLLETNMALMAMK